MEQFKDIHVVLYFNNSKNFTQALKNSFEFDAPWIWINLVSNEWPLGMLWLSSYVS
jgi:hypothetical protein